MIFKLTSSIILVTFAVTFASSDFLNGVDAAFTQQQLRGSRTNYDNYVQRKMVSSGSDGSFCPKDAPADGSSCANILPDGISGGNCGWQSTSWDGASTTIFEQNSCACTKEEGIWSCSKEIETKTSPPAPSPPPVTAPDDNFCPQYSPKTNAECGLTGMWVGTCYYSSNAQENETPNNNSQACSCKDKMFTCSSQPYPNDVPSSPIPAPTTQPPQQQQGSDDSDSWCPKEIPVTNGTCSLPTGKTNGSCMYYSTASGVTTENVCGCKADSLTYLCTETKSSV